MSFTFAEPTEWWLDISGLQSGLESPGSGLVTPARRWIASINQLCLTAIVNWIKSEYAADATCLSPTTLSSIWEFVGGFVISAGTVRLAFIPSEEIAGNELDVPQEWVDIPRWKADYYLATQLDPAANSVRVWGYGTHQQLKTVGEYDARDRTYSLNGESLVRDLSTLWVTIECCPNAQTQVEVAPLPALSPTQAENLIQRLGDPSVSFPRLSSPFALWGALLERDDWRQHLYQRRLAGTATVPVTLSNWLQGRFDQAWQALDAVLSPQQLNLAWRNRQDTPLSPSQPIFAASRVKVLEFGPLPAEQAIALLVGISPMDESTVTVGVQINPVGDRISLPDAVHVRLLDVAGNEIGQAGATVTETIRLQFTAEPGDGFRVEVTCGAVCQTESFMV